MPKRYLSSYQLALRHLPNAQVEPRRDHTVPLVIKEGDNRGGVWLMRQNFQKSDRSHNEHLAGLRFFSA